MIINLYFLISLYPVLSEGGQQTQIYHDSQPRIMKRMIIGRIRFPRGGQKLQVSMPEIENLISSSCKPIIIQHNESINCKRVLKLKRKLREQRADVNETFNESESCNTQIDLM